MTFEERRLLPTGAWDDIEELFLPSKISDLIHHSPSTHERDLLQRLSTTDLVYGRRSKDLPRLQTGRRLKEVESSLRQARWRNHDLFAKSKTALEEMFRKNDLGNDDSKSKLVEKLCKNYS